MLFNPKNLKKTEGSFVFSGEVKAEAHGCFRRGIFREFWNGFTYRCSTLHVTETDGYVFRIGEAEELPADGQAYSICVQETGICIRAENEKNLILGFMTLIDRIEAIDAADGSTALSVGCCRITESPAIGTRMAHFCVFPETELWELHRFIRFCGALRYSQVIVEFWGMYRYDCMKELAWPHAYTKEELQPIFREANDMGLEIVPMFNHWGHAAAGRVMHGKHVVLDQSPSLETYFCENGWCWDIRKPKVRDLLRKIRRELLELCGTGSYFHIGCDEAYGFDLNTEGGMNAVCDFIGEIADEMAEVNRRILVWGDMFLYRHPHYNSRNGYAANAPSPRSEAYMLERLNRKVIIADWQYDANEAPVETALVFKKAGLDCMICPWDRSHAKLNSCLTTAKEQNLAGLIHTTWHTLSAGTPYVAMAAVGCFEDHPGLSHTGTAALLRKVYFVDGDWQKAGWAKQEIGILT